MQRAGWYNAGRPFGILCVSLTSTTPTVSVAPTSPGDRNHARVTAVPPLVLPIACALLLAAVGLLPSVRSYTPLLSSILGAAAALLVGVALIAVRARARTLQVDAAVRPQHYLQACMQTTVLVYWGWYWRPVYDALPLIAAQLVFAYAFDMLLAWWRRDRYTLGFGPFPVVLSTNLFLWFKPDWFFLQFVMIAAGFAAKELIRWDRDGRSAHIFNPSSFPLAIASLGLIATGTTSWTWGAEIAQTQFNPPQIYVVLFLVGLPGQFLFGVTPMTMSAVLTTYVLGVGYFLLTGSYFFVGSYIPVAAFLGMHLLFTDPSTSPRTELGRIMFGMMYGASLTALYGLLAMIGAPTFYDKLLPVPLMNLSVRALDRMASSIGVLDPRRDGRPLSARRRNLAYMTVWAIAFGALSAIDAVGDDHPGRHLPFWQRACEADARHACANLTPIMDAHCKDGSAWACNEIGVLRWRGKVAAPERAAADFLRACERGFTSGCLNLRLLAGDATEPSSMPPPLNEYPILLRTGKGPVRERSRAQLLSRACHHGFSDACRQLDEEATDAE